jgi:hypothetical protein
MNYLTMSELDKIHEITKRLESLQSPVLRLQAILQFSQIVDILAIGDSAQPLHNRIMNDVDEIDELQAKVHEYEQQAQSEPNADAPESKLTNGHEVQANAIGGEGTPANPPTLCVAVAASSPDALTDSESAA